MNKFTVEEINLMCICDTKTRVSLINNLERIQTLVNKNETTLVSLIISVTEKLKSMTDSEYSALTPELIPDYEE